MTQFQKHHIVPVYRCIELGLTTSYKIDGVEFYFKENMVEVTRHQHALIHWGYKCKDLNPLLEVCNPPQYVRDMIPLGDNRDSGAAVLIARGEIEQIDMFGENHPSWKGGITKDEEYQKEYHKAYKQIPEHKEKNRVQMRAHIQKPEVKEYKKKYNKKYYAKKKIEPEYREELRLRSAKYYAKKKLERKGQGTLEQFL